MVLEKLFTALACGTFACCSYFIYRQDYKPAHVLGRRFMLLFVLISFSTPHCMRND